METVSQKTGLSTYEIRQTSRVQRVVRARNMYFYIAKKYSKESLAEIGSVVFGKDHATVIHGIKKCEDKMKTEPMYKSLVLQCVAEIESHISADKSASSVDDGQIFNFVDFVEQNYGIHIPRRAVAEWLNYNK